MEYVECSECGHPLERHDKSGCRSTDPDSCTCPTRWTRVEIKRVRRENGLPCEWRI